MKLKVVRSWRRTDTSLRCAALPRSADQWPSITPAAYYDLYSLQVRP